MDQMIATSRAEAVLLLMADWSEEERAAVRMGLHPRPALRIYEPEPATVGGDAVLGLDVPALNDLIDRLGRAKPVAGDDLAAFPRVGEFLGFKTEGAHGV